MAASTAFDKDALVPMAQGNGQIMFFYTSTDLGATLGDTTVASYFSSASASFATGGGDVVFCRSLGTTENFTVLVTDSASSTGITMIDGLTATGVLL